MVVSTWLPESAVSEWSQARNVKCDRPWKRQVRQEPDPRRRVGRQDQGVVRSDGGRHPGPVRAVGAELPDAELADPAFTVFAGSSPVMGMPTSSPSSSVGLFGRSDTRVPAGRPWA